MKNGPDASPIKRQLVSISEDEEGEMESYLVKVDAEIKEEKQSINLMSEDYKRKRVRINSNMKSAMTQDTGDKELSISKDD